MAEYEFEFKGANLRMLLKASWVFAKLRFSRWTAYYTHWILDILGHMVLLITAFFMSRLLSPAVEPFLGPYGSNYVAFLILGTALFNPIEQIRRTPYNAINIAFLEGSYELYAMSPVGIKALMIGSIIWESIYWSGILGLYLTLGTLFFGLTLNPRSNYGLAFLLYFLLVLAVIGLGLIDAAMVSLLEAKQWRTPLNLFMSIVAPIVAGVYFPIEILPPWILTLSYLLPHTFGFQAVRRVLLAGDSLSNPTVSFSLIALSIYCVVIVILGILLFSRSLRKAEKDGNLSRWT